MKTQRNIERADEQRQLAQQQQRVRISQGGRRHRALPLRGVTAWRHGTPAGARCERARSVLPAPTATVALARRSYVEPRWLPEKLIERRLPAVLRQRHTAARYEYTLAAQTLRLAPARARALGECNGAAGGNHPVPRHVRIGRQLTQHLANEPGAAWQTARSATWP